MWTWNILWCVTLCVSLQWHACITYPIMNQSNDTQFKMIFVNKNMLQCFSLQNTALMYIMQEIGWLIMGINWVNLPQRWSHLGLMVQGQWLNETYASNTGMSLIRKNLEVCGALLCLTLGIKLFNCYSI